MALRLHMLWIPAEAGKITTSPEPQVERCLLVERVRVEHGAKPATFSVFTQKTKAGIRTWCALLVTIGSLGLHPASAKSDPSAPETLSANALAVNGCVYNRPIGQGVVALYCNAINWSITAKRAYGTVNSLLVSGNNFTSVDTPNATAVYDPNCVPVQLTNNGYTGITTIVDPSRMRALSIELQVTGVLAEAQARTNTLLSIDEPSTRAVLRAASISPSAARTGRASQPGNRISCSG